MTSLPRLLAASGGGFLLAVLWMDLMFDVQVLRFPRTQRELSDDVLRSIAAYYRRVTTDASPMGRVVGVVMAVVVASVLYRLLAGDGPRAAALVSLGLCTAPVALAMRRTFPNAVRLGAGSGDGIERSRLARAICRDHLFCVAAIGSFLLLQWIAG